MISPVFAVLLAFAANPAVPEPLIPGPQIEFQTFAGYDYYTAGDGFGEFELGRAELGLAGAHPAPLGYELRLEAIRAAGRESVTGVDGDSLVLRVKRAWGSAGAELFGVRGDLRLGLIADPWVEAAESGYPLRDLSAMSAERRRFFDAADLGIGAVVSAFDERLFVRMALTNGEGRNEIEQNEGKSSTFALSSEVLRFEVLGERGVLALHAGYRNGSRGLGDAREERFALALTFAHPRFSAGAEYVRAMGIDARPDREADALGGWATGYAWPRWLGFAARHDHDRLDLDADGATRDRLTAAVFVELAGPMKTPDLERFRVYAGAERVNASQSGAALPGAPEASDPDRFFLTLSFNAEHIISDSPRETPP